MTKTNMPGWCDQRLAQAYGLIGEALEYWNNPETDSHSLLKQALEAVENADVALEHEGHVPQPRTGGQP